MDIGGFASCSFFFCLTNNALKLIKKKTHTQNTQVTKTEEQFTKPDLTSTPEVSLGPGRFPVS